MRQAGLTASDRELQSPCRRATTLSDSSVQILCYVTHGMHAGRPGLQSNRSGTSSPLSRKAPSVRREKLEPVERAAAELEAVASGGGGEDGAGLAWGECR